METIEEIKNEMKDWFGFELTDQQVQEFLNDYPNVNHFDTLERETFADYIAKKVTGMSFPMNGDSQEYKQKFYAELKKKFKINGYMERELMPHNYKIWRAEHPQAKTWTFFIPKGK